MKSSKKKVKLELAWEAVQEPYSTYANVLAYTEREGLRSFCTFVEKTYLIKISNKKIQAYYNANEQAEAAKGGLQDFLNPKWIKIFKRRAQFALKESRLFIDKYQQKKLINKNNIVQAVKDGSVILNSLFISFQACQPQYTRLVESYIKNLLDSQINNKAKNNIIAVLSFSIAGTPILKEEIIWSGLIKKLKGKFKKLPKFSQYPYNELDIHATKFGFIGASDGLKPWTKKTLYERLQKDWNDKEILSVLKKWQKQKKIIQKNKRLLIKKYKISNKVINLCKNISLLGQLRLELRVNGWMPVISVLINDLFPQLSKHIPYTAKQLENCVYPELLNILKGDYTLTPQELEQRNKLIFYGIINEKKVLWSGSSAVKEIKKLIPNINQSRDELKGQSATSGKVTGKCYVIRWDADDLKSDIINMPKGSILVAGQTRPQLMSAIKKAAAIVTDEGGILSHAAIISRELNIPCVIGTKIATQIFKNGDRVEVNANEGIIIRL